MPNICCNIILKKILFCLKCKELAIGLQKKSVNKYLIWLMIVYRIPFVASRYRKRPIQHRLQMRLYHFSRIWRVLLSLHFSDWIRLTENYVVSGFVFLKISNWIINNVYNINSVINKITLFKYLSNLCSSYMRLRTHIFG